MSPLDSVQGSAIDRETLGQEATAPVAWKATHAPSPSLSYKDFQLLQARAERLGGKLRRHEAGGAVRVFFRWRGVSHELRSIDDFESFVSTISSPRVPPWRA